jgi:hypothetical protein
MNRKMIGEAIYIRVSDLSGALHSDREKKSPCEG